MRLTNEQKTVEMFNAIAKMNEEIFAEDERAPREKLKTHFLQDDIYVVLTTELGAQDPIGFAFVTERGGPYLMIMAVASAYRGYGYGKWLLDEITGNYPGAAMTLTCKVDNVSAQVLYLRNGFRPVRVIPRYYGETDGLLMRRMS
jgi:ribosomal protein S18 acetylase RimI-like enzyme